MTEAIRDQNHVTVALGVSNVSATTPLPFTIDSLTGRLMTDSTGGGSGTVTSVSVATANGFSGSVANSTTTPAITIATTVTGVLKGNGTAISAAVANTDYQSPISLTTTGTSGAATFIANVLNIPQYTSFTSPLTTKGDIFTYTTTDARLPVGANGEVLSADSTEPTGLKWIPVSGTGTVTTVSVVTANGVSGSVANATTTPAITLTLGAITPSSVTSDLIKASTSAGLLMESANGTDVGLLGAGNTANITWYGNHNYNTATQDTIAAFTGTGKTLGSLALATYPSLLELSYVKGVTSAIQTQLNGKQDTGNYITALTGDVTASGPGSASATLANTAVTPGSYTNTNITVDSKGRITAASNGSGGGGTPGGSTTQVQYNNAGAFGGISGVTTDGTTMATSIATGASVTTGFVISTSTAATNNNQKWSPSLRLTGNQWNTDGGSSSPVSWDVLVRPIQSFSTLNSALDFYNVNNSLVVASLQLSGLNSYAFVPGSNDGMSIGTTTLSISDVFIASGGVINWNNGNATLTHSTGLITSNVAFSVGTSNAITAGTIELGAASDTTISRSSAGVIAVEGVVIPSVSSSNTITGKRNQPRTASSTTASNLSPDLSTANVYYRTTQTGSLTIDAPAGTPVIGEVIVIYVDSAGAQTLTINATYIPFGAAFPATTTAGKTFMMTAQYNGTNWKTLWANAV